jgi:ubiquinone/menaquinone biosynthesis C-methylase UbiE
LSDLSAEHYEHQVEVLFGGAADAMRRLIIQPLKERFGSIDGEGLTFLELGAGTGRATRFVRLAFPKAKIVAVDLSGPYLKRAQKQLAPFDRHDFVEANAETLPFQDQQFDAVYSVFLFHELPEAVRKSVIRESLRVLCSGGFFGFVDSLQIGDVSEFDDSLAMFPTQYHEPFYKNYIETPMANLIESQGLKIFARGTGFFSKFIAAVKS